MRYRLVFDAEAGQPEKEVAFEAVDAAAALIYAQRESAHHSAVLWKDDEKLCKICRTGEDPDIWQIVSVA